MNNEIVKAGDGTIQLSSLGVQFEGDVSEQAVDDLLRKAGTVARGCMFIIGDAINFANGKYGEKYDHWMRLAYGGEIYQGEHEAILDEKTWAAAQAILKRNARDGGAGVRNKYGALLRGLLFCGTCGCAMTHSYTCKGNTRYRYYVCQKAMRQGWSECETRSVPAQEIEDFVLQRLAKIGSDPELAKSVAAQAQEEYQHQGDALRTEIATIEKSLREQAHIVAGLFDQPNTAARLADLEAQIRAGETRLAEIAVELAALGADEIDATDVTQSLRKFTQVASALTPVERERLVHLLVERVVYDRVLNSGRDRL